MPVLRWVAGALGVLASGVNAQGRLIHGVVVDSSGAPVSYANVILSASGRRTAADADGRFRLSIDSSARRSIYVRRIGFQPQTVELDEWPDSAIRVVLTAASRTLSTITIAAERSQSLAIHGFYERMNDVERGINYGYFITPEDIEQRKGSRPSDLMTGIPGVRVRQVKTGDPRFFKPSDRKGWEVQGPDFCRMEVYIDGVRLVNLGTTKQNLPDSHLFLDDIVNLTSIAGIEVYPRSVTAPPKYQSLNGLCGVVLIWTR
jgi:carboxypeptidase family protein/TonB-dependent receptor-like protein